MERYVLSSCSTAAQYGSSWVLLKDISEPRDSLTLERSSNVLGFVKRHHASQSRVALSQLCTTRGGVEVTPVYPELRG